MTSWPRSITYIGTPGEYVQYGPVLPFLANLISFPVIVWIVGRWLVPAFMRQPITSAYELLESRLGMGVRRLGSVSYIVTRLLWMALILFTSAKVLVYVTGCDPRWIPVIAVVVGVVITTYTLFGGIRTVMVTKAVQFCLLVAGALLTIATVTWHLHGIAAWWPMHREAHWLPQPFFSFDPHMRVTIVGTFIYYAVCNIAAAGSDQSAVQRFLTTRDARAASRAFLLNQIAVVVVSVILGLVGAALLGFYRAHPGNIRPGLSFATTGDAFLGAVRGNIFEVAGKTVNLLGCPLFGLFFLALFVPYATPFGAVMGAVYSFAAAFLTAYWDVLTGKPAISFLWISTAAFAVSLMLGPLFCLVPVQGRSRPVQVGWTIACLIPLALAGGILARFG